MAVAAARLIAFCVISALGCLAQPGTVVFSKGEANYFCIKIPYIFTTHKGTLLAFGEARKYTCQDWDATDLVYKRSTDGGQTWSALAVLYGNSTAGQPNVWIGNAAPLQDRDSGRIVVPFCRNNLQVLLTHSDDDGVTWTAPFNLTGVTMPDWTWVGLGPPGGMQLQSGRYLIPSYHSFTKNDDGEFSSGHVMLSDDRGATWYIGGNWTFGKQLPNECQGVELAPNQVFINSRSISEIRIGAISNDGGLTWPQVFKINDLVQPNTGCEGSTVRHPKTGWLFYSGLNEHNLIALRWNMTVYISKDNGTSWQLWKVVFSGSAAYSSLTIRPDMSVGLLYEWETALHLEFFPTAFSYTTVWTMDDIDKEVMDVPWPSPDAPPPVLPQHPRLLI